MEIASAHSRGERKTWCACDFTNVNKPPYSINRPVFVRLWRAAHPQIHLLTGWSGIWWLTWWLAQGFHHADSTSANQSLSFIRLTNQTTSDESLEDSSRLLSKQSVFFLFIFILCRILCSAMKEPSRRTIFWGWMNKGLNGGVIEEPYSEQSVKEPFFSV